MELKKVPKKPSTQTQIIRQSSLKSACIISVATNQTHYNDIITLADKFCKWVERDE